MSTPENAGNVEPIQRRSSRGPKNGSAALREGLAFRIGRWGAASYWRK